MASFAAQVERYLKNNGVAVTGVSIGDPSVKATWKVEPANLQAAAASAIASFNANDPAVIADIRLQDFTATGRGKDNLATIALVVRARGIAAWNAMTTQEKKDAVNAEVTVWVNIRGFIEDNL